MALDPTDYQTWTSFSDHPIFGEAKHDIDRWSHDPSRYDDLNNYSQFLPQWYVHVDPPPPESEQVVAADRDISNLASVCAAIEKAFGHLRYELIVLDDFTAYLWIECSDFAIELYSDTWQNKSLSLMLFVDYPEDLEAEYECETNGAVVDVLRQLICS